MINISNLSGETLGDYLVQERLGAGGFGYVYKGQHLLLDEMVVALKVHKSIYDERDPQAVQNFAAMLREAQTHVKLKHAFILPLVEMRKQPLATDARQAIFYLLMEYAPGKSLRERLNKRPGQPLPLQQALTILWQVAQALDWAHRHADGPIVHRDLKPANILFNARDEALVADFGLATKLTAGKTGLVDRSGTPDYMSPEQFNGEVSVKSDQYALGCIAYEILTGRHPFAGDRWEVWQYQHQNVLPEDLTRYNAQIPVATSRAVLKALAKNRDDRHDTILQFVSAMQDTREQKSFTEWYKEGHDYYKMGNYGAALTAYQEAGQLRPTFADVHFNQGMALYQLQNYEQATDAFHQALTYDTEQTKFYVQAGITFSKRREFAEAVQMYQKAVQRNPGHQKASELLGDAYYALKQYQNAVQAYKLALGLSVSEDVKTQTFAPGSGVRPEEARLYMNLGLALKHVQRSEEALVAFECSLQLNSGSALTHYHKGKLLYEFHQDKRAVNAFNEALNIQPRFARAYRAKGQALRRLGLLKEAREADEMADFLEKEAEE